MSSLSNLLQIVQSYILRPENKFHLSLLKGIRNGLVYHGAFPGRILILMGVLSGISKILREMVASGSLCYGTKIRFPHSLVMTFLFREGSLRTKATDIANATFIHAKNLASFVFIYRIITRALLMFTSKNQRIRTFISAFITGYIVFGKYNKVNEQVNLYLMSRVVYGFAHLAVKQYRLTSTDLPASSSDGPAFPWFAAMVWGLALLLFEHEQDVLQPSLQASMTYLYHDSQQWTGLLDFLPYNKPPTDD